MKEIISWIASSWLSYWGEGYYQYLLLVAILYLLIFKRKKESSRAVLPYLFIALLVFIFPLSAGIIMGCIGKSVYWRILWIIPTELVVALAVTEFVKTRKNGGSRFLVLVLLCGIIGVSGKSVWRTEAYSKVNNYQKVPDEIAQICNIIREDAGEEEIRLVADDFVASYARIYDPSILMPYGRAGRGGKMKSTLMLYDEISSDEPNYKKIGILSRSRKCNYLAIKISEESQKKILAQCGYKEIAMVNEYGVFKIDKAFLEE